MATETEKNYIPGLDGMRAISVLMVLVGHFGLSHIVPAGFGVTIFFFISGFLITTLLIAEYKRDGRIGVKDFYIRRLLRLMPELLGLIVFSALIGAAFGLYPKLSDYLAALFYFTNYLTVYQQAVDPAGNTHVFWPQLWSLAVEEHYYLTVPLLLSLLIKRMRMLVVFMLGLLVLSLVLRCIWIYGGFALGKLQYPYTYLASETRIDSIAYGALFALFMNRARERGYSASTWVQYGALALGGAILLASLLYREPNFRETTRYSVQGIGLWLVFFHFYAGKASILMPLLELKQMRWMGLMSYGAYLWHLEYSRIAALYWPVETMSKGALAAFVILGILVSFALAFVSYQCLAKPVAKLRRRFGSHTV